ncbi:hypothetical protein HIM_06619 [Hirsutella minnesotensis 3608]|uniref:Uncharacterized protein n=1 Tax=Hirsutella minnesotensis 3608 TaxID=1043627 RepID=A0A0F7ZIS1_9HYPO|nr:hypothetical protein HIM_06619 [Hirsutella minnesotensis 3608]
MDSYLLSPPLVQGQRPRPQHGTCEACPPPAYQQQWLSSRENRPLPPPYDQATQPQAASMSTSPATGDGDASSPEGRADQQRSSGFLTRCWQKMADATAFDEEKESPRVANSGMAAMAVVQVQGHGKANSDMCFGSCCRK